MAHRAVLATEGKTGAVDIPVHCLPYDLSLGLPDGREGKRVAVLCSEKENRPMTLPNDCLEAVARAMVRAEWDGLPDAEMEEFVDIEWPAHEKTARAGFLAGLRAVRELDDDLLEYGARAASLVKTTDDPLGAVPVPYDECDSNYRADWRNESEASWKAIMDQLIKEIEQS